MMSLSQAYEDRRLIRVLVAPVGNNSQFLEQFRIVSHLTAVPYFELLRPQYPRNYASPFKFLNWNEGALVFQYNRYDRVSLGLGDLDDFQSSKRTLLVMGLINFSELMQQKVSIEEEIEKFNKRYPHIPHKRFCVFNFNFDSPSESLASRLSSSDTESLVIFPPNGACEGGSMQEVHAREMLCHCAVKIIQSLEKQMEVCEEARLKNSLPAELPLCSAYDDRDDISLPRESSVALSTKNKKMYKKRPVGRIRKWMGDLCMQVCSPLDAVENYIIAVNECRSLGDSLWLAGALDGYASAILLLREHFSSSVSLEDVLGKDLKTVSLSLLSPAFPPSSAGTTSNAAAALIAPSASSAAAGSVSASAAVMMMEDDDDVYTPEIDKVFLLAEERVQEALSVYSSSIVLKHLEVEACVRLAIMYEHCAQQSMCNVFVLKIVEYTMRAVSVPGLSPTQQIESLLECALIFHRLGLRRKYALFLYVAAQMTAESGNYEGAQALLAESCAQIGVTLELTDAEEDEEEEGTNTVSNQKRETERDDESTVPLTAWESVSLTLSTNGVLLSEETNDTQASVRYLSHMLTLIARAERRHATQRDRVFAKYTRKLLGLEKFVKKRRDTNPNNNNNNNNNSNNNGPNNVLLPNASHSGAIAGNATSSPAPASSTPAALTEESLRRLQSSSSAAAAAIGRAHTERVRERESFTMNNASEHVSVFRDKERERETMTLSRARSVISESSFSAKPFLSSASVGGNNANNNSNNGVASSMSRRRSFNPLIPPSHNNNFNNNYFTSSVAETDSLSLSMSNALTGNSVHTNSFYTNNSNTSNNINNNNNSNTNNNNNRPESPSLFASQLNDLSLNLMRTFTVPKLPNKIAEFVEKSQEILLAPSGSQRLQTGYNAQRNGPTQVQGRRPNGDKLLRAFLVENSGLEVAPNNFAASPGAVPSSFHAPSHEGQGKDNDNANHMPSSVNRNNGSSSPHTALTQVSPVAQPHTPSQSPSSLFHFVEIEQARELLQSVAARLTAQRVALTQQSSALAMLSHLAHTLTFTHAYAHTYARVPRPLAISLPVCVRAVWPRRVPLSHTPKRIPESLEKRLWESVCGRVTALRTESENLAALSLNGESSFSQNTPTQPQRSQTQSQTQTATQSAFFYDPFAARRALSLAAERSTRESETLAWPAHCEETAFVCILSNPLSVSVCLSEVSVRLCGIARSVQVKDVVIPPCVRHFAVVVPMCASLSHTQAHSEEESNVLCVRDVCLSLGGSVQQRVRVNDFGLAVHTTHSYNDEDSDCDDESESDTTNIKSRDSDKLTKSQKKSLDVLRNSYQDCVATRRVRVVDEHFSFDTLLSWHSPALSHRLAHTHTTTVAPVIPQSSDKVKSSNVTCNTEEGTDDSIKTSISLFPGERRRESLSLSLPRCESVLYDHRVTVTELPQTQSAKTPVNSNKARSYVLKDFKYLGEDLDSNSDKINANTVDYPATCNAIERVDYCLPHSSHTLTHCTRESDTVVREEVSMCVRAPRGSVDCQNVRIDVQVVALPATLSQLLHTLTQLDTLSYTETHTDDERRTVLRERALTLFSALSSRAPQSSPSPLILFSRTQLVSLALCGVSGCTVKRVSLSQTLSLAEQRVCARLLSQALRSHYDVRYVRSQSEREREALCEKEKESAPTILALTTHPTFVLEIANQSALEMTVSECESAHTLAVVPPHTTQRCLLSHLYSDFVSACDTLSPQRLLCWSVWDAERPSLTGTTQSGWLQSRNDDAHKRWGYLELRSNDLVTTVDASAQSSLLRDAVSTLPHIGASLSLTLEGRSPTQCDFSSACASSPRIVPLCHFFDISLILNSLTHPQCAWHKPLREVEVVLTLTETERDSRCVTMLFDEDGVLCEDDETAHSNKRALTTQPFHTIAEGCVVSGKLHTRYDVSLSHTKALTHGDLFLCEHTVTCCALRPGRYSVRVFVRPHYLEEVDEEERDRNVWWSATPAQGLELLAMHCDGEEQ